MSLELKARIVAHKYWNTRELVALEGNASARERFEDFFNSLEDGTVIKIIVQVVNK